MYPGNNFNTQLIPFVNGGLEKQMEDVPHDMEAYTDTEGYVYDFAYGLDWKGVIKDERVKKYK